MLGMSPILHRKEGHPEDKLSRQVLRSIKKDRGPPEVELNRIIEKITQNSGWFFLLALLIWAEILWHMSKSRYEAENKSRDFHGLVRERVHFQSELQDTSRNRILQIKGYKSLNFVFITRIKKWIHQSEIQKTIFLFDFSTEKYTLY